MKKLFNLLTVVTLVVTMLGAVLPANVAFAKSTGPATLNVYNNSTGNMVIDLWTAGGARLSYVVSPHAMSSLVLPTGWYRYSARLECGLRAGGVQVKNVKKLYLTCRMHG